MSECLRRWSGRGLHISLAGGLHVLLVVVFGILHLGWYVSLYVGYVPKR